MTIPQGDPRGLHSVSDRRKVTFASEGAAQTSDCQPEEELQQGEPSSGNSTAAVNNEEGGDEFVARDRRKRSIEATPTATEEKGEREEEEVEKGEKEVLASQVNLKEYGLRDSDISAKEKIVRNDPELAPRALRISSLPLLDLPKSTDLALLPSFSNSNDRKLSLNLPYFSNPSQQFKKPAAPPSAATSATRKVRRKSLPQRIGLRYHKIPQEDFSPCDVSPSLPPGNLNLACATSPTFNATSSPSLPPPSSSSSSSYDQHYPHEQQQQQHRPNLSVHNAQVHASFHKDSDNNSLRSHFGVKKHQQQQLDSLIRIHSALDAESNKDKKKKHQNTLLPTSGQSRKKQNLSRAVSLSSKSLDDLAGLHTGRGQPDKSRRSKKPGRSVSTEDLAGLRIHHRAGRPAADPHPSPGSPSHCCLVSVSRVPNMAAATSHLTLDSEYQTVRLAVLGAPGVGKSAIVKQFVMQQFLEEYVPTEQRQVFCPAVIINEHLYEVRIIDCPYIPYFPVNSLYEWTDFRGYGLRNATAYVLVYDITSEESFEYIKSLRLQILESRNRHDVPIFVVGNKHDLADERGVSRREVANLVKKQWKCGYIECSAKYNWHIMLLFKELMKTIDYIDYGHKPTSMRVQDALRRNRCLIL